MDSLFEIALIPVIFLLYFVHKKDPHPEQMKFLLKIFGFGCLSTIPVLICESLYDNLMMIPEDYGRFALFWNTFWGVAFIEEIFKWIAMFAMSYHSKKFDETYDGIVYGAFSSMGFACIENILFVVLGFSMLTGIFRAITAVPGHFCYGVIMGYFLSKARLNKENGKSSILYILLSIVLPTLLHALYDYFILASTPLSILAWIVFMIITFTGCFILIKKTAKNNVPIGVPEVTPAPTPAPAQTMPAAPVAIPAAPITPAAPAPATPTMPTGPIGQATPITQPTVAEPVPTPTPIPTPTPAPPPPSLVIEDKHADTTTTISWETDQNG